MRTARLARLLLTAAFLPAATVSGQTGSITSNFNGAAITAGSDIWFNSVFKLTGETNGTQLDFVGSHITFDVGATHYNIAIPNAVIMFSSSLTSGSTTFSGGRWVTDVPLTFHDNTWLSGLAYVVPTTLPGGISNVTWSGTFLSNTSGLNVNWQWGAAVYSQSAAGCTTGSLSGNPNSLGVKPLHSTSLDPYHTGDQAGTTENFANPHCWINGARGGGSSNFTGSMSNTGTVRPGVMVTPEPAPLVLLATALLIVGGVAIRRNA